MAEKIKGQDKASELVKALEQTEDFFFQAKEEKLHRFVLDIIEKPLIENVLYKTEGNQIKAAKILGINRNTLHAKIKRLEIKLGQFKQ